MANSQNLFLVKIVAIAIASERKEFYVIKYKMLLLLHKKDVKIFSQMENKHSSFQGDGKDLKNLASYCFRVAIHFHPISWPTIVSYVAVFG